MERNAYKRLHKRREEDRYERNRFRFSQRWQLALFSYSFSFSFSSYLRTVLNRFLVANVLVECFLQLGAINVIARRLLLVYLGSFFAVLANVAVYETVRVAHLLLALARSLMQQANNY